LGDNNQFQQLWKKIQAYIRKHASRHQQRMPQDNYTSSPTVVHARKEASMAILIGQTHSCEEQVSQANLVQGSLAQGAHALVKLALLGASFTS